MKFEELVKWGLIIGGGYLLYEYFLAPAPVPTNASATGGATGGTTTTPTTTTQQSITSIPVNAALAQSLTSAMRQYNGGAVTGNISQWNWVYQKMNGSNVSIITQATSYADNKIDAVTYLQLRASMGLSGVNSSGLGMIYSIDNAHIHTKPVTGQVTTGSILYSQNGGRVRRHTTANTVGPTNIYQT